jgi:hypothetical protein
MVFIAFLFSSSKKKLIVKEIKKLQIIKQKVDTRPEIISSKTYLRQSLSIFLAYNRYTKESKIL